MHLDDLLTLNTVLGIFNTVRNKVVWEEKMTNIKEDFQHPASAAIASMKLFCKAMRLDVDDCRTESFVAPDDIKVGDEFIVPVRCEGHDCRSGVGAQAFADTVELPIVLMANSEKNDNLYFKVAPKVIRFPFNYETATVCWGVEPAASMRVWAVLSDDRYFDQWKTCSDHEDSVPSRLSAKITYSDAGEELHPSLMV